MEYPRQCVHCNTGQGVAPYHCDRVGAQFDLCGNHGMCPWCGAVGTFGGEHCRYGLALLDDTRTITTGNQSMDYGGDLSITPFYDPMPSSSQGSRFALPMFPTGNQGQLIQNTVDTTPRGRVGMMNYLGPGDILRYFHAIHLLAQVGTLAGELLIILTRKLFKAVDGLLTTVVATPTRRDWQIALTLAHSLHENTLDSGLVVTWLVLEQDGLVLDRKGILKVYPTLVRDIGQQFDFQFLLHYFEGNLKQWPKKVRPKVGSTCVTPIKIDRDPIMLRAIYNPIRSRPPYLGGLWYHPFHSFPCMRVRIDVFRQRAKKKKKDGTEPDTQVWDVEYDDDVLEVDPRRCILLFVRHHTGEMERNTQPSQVAALVHVARAFNLTVVLAGQPTMKEYAKFMSGCHTEHQDVPLDFCCFPFTGKNLLEQMQIYASFLCAVGNNASALDLASAAGIPVFRDIEFPAFARSQNYERRHNSFLRRALNLGVAPWAMLEQGETFKSGVRFGRGNEPIRLVDTRHGRYPCLKTPATLEKLLFYFVGSVCLGRPEVSEPHHITLPDGIGGHVMWEQNTLEAISLDQLYSCIKTNDLPTVLASFWRVFATFEVDTSPVEGSAWRSYLQRFIDPNAEPQDLGGEEDDDGL